MGFVSKTDGMRSDKSRSFKVTKSVSRKKAGTATTKKHRFESFSQRIAKFNVEPVRRAQARNHVHRQNESSHFITAFEEWKDLNMSENFTSFVKVIEPLSHSLPQVLLYETQIVDHLVAYMRKADALSLEPLLDLVVHFAHDLGVRFEAHFEVVISTVTHLAATHPDFEVIQASFTCLAWLFKYLSRLLVPDLRPMYNLMAPLLGKQHQKYFVTESAAKAMTLLIRKAGSPENTSQITLKTIAEYAFADLANVSPEQLPQYQQGLKILFAEAIRGVQNRVHSNAKSIVQSLLTTLYEGAVNGNAKLDDLQYVIESIIIDVIHSTDREGFAPVLGAILEFTDLALKTRDEKHIRIVTHLLFVVTATRKGTRIHDWSYLFSRISTLLDVANLEVESLNTNSLHAILTTVSVVLSYAPLDEVVPISHSYFDKINGENWDQVFLSFCSLSAEVSLQRFKTVILPEMQKFILSRWDKYEIQLCFLLSQFAKSGVFYAHDINIPTAWQETMSQNFGILAEAAGSTVAHLKINDQTELIMALCSSYLDLITTFHAGIVIGNIVNPALLRIVRSAVRSNAHPEASSSLTTFGISQALFFLASSEISAAIAMDLLLEVLEVAAIHAQRPLYLKGVLKLIQRCGTKGHESPTMKIFIDNLIENLASPSHDLRLLSIEILCSCYAEVPDGLNAVWSLELSPFSPENERSATLYVRRIAAAFAGSEYDENIKRVFPAYCFGLLHVRLASLWKDACDALKLMSEVKGKEELIAQRAISWVSQLSTTETMLEHDLKAEIIVETERVYDCSNLMTLKRLAFQSSVETCPAKKHLRNQLFLCIQSLPREDALNRSQGLRVLKALPRLAERKSRALVPILLEWALENDSDTWEEHEYLEEVESRPEEGANRSSMRRWSRKDQKDLLNLFAQFVNPVVLYRSDAVYNALLNLLGNGDVEIQQSALKAVFAWGIPSLKPYEEHLTNVLDDARFREEIAIFLNVDEADSEIRREHYAGLMPVLLRLLYGRIVSRSGSSSTRGTQQAKRRAVLMSLSRFGHSELSDFLGIALGSLDSILLVDDGVINEDALAKNCMPVRKQVGMLKMLGDTLQVLADLLAPFAERLLNAILYCTVRANRQLNTQSKQTGVDEENLAFQNASLIKEVRKEGLNCLNLLFSACPDFHWTMYASVIIQEIVEPRLDGLPVETAQSVSGILKLFSTWSTSMATVILLVKPCPNLLERVADCLNETSSRDEVKVFVLKNILENFLDFGLVNPRLDNQDSVVSSQLKDCINCGLGYCLLERVSKMLDKTSSKECLEFGIKTIIRLEFCVTKVFDVKALIETSLRLLRQPARLVNPRLKSEVLSLLERFIPRYNFTNDKEFFQTALRTISSLFSYFRDGHNRTLLVSLFSQLSNNDNQLTEVAELCQKLNAYSSARLDEPDFEKRLQAFHFINEYNSCGFSVEQWQPLVHNMLFFIKDNDELSIRTSASLSLRRFVQNACATPGQLTVLEDLMNEAVVPDIQSGMRETSELVRTEYVALLSELVKSNWPQVHDMKSLLGADDESSFFNNILHIQQHRRIRALRRLSAECANISSNNISRFCLPLIENFFVDVEDSAHNLAAEGINTLESLAEGLEWQRYRALLQRNVNSAVKLESKFHIRALAAVVNALGRAFSERSLRNPDTNGDSMKGHEVYYLKNLARTLPDNEALSKSLSNSVFAKLVDLVHYKDESTVDLRILIAVIAVKVNMVFPADQIEQSLPPILMDVCNILKSKAQEARDIARKTLADIAAVVGSKYFGFIVKQLRTALQRGSHLHVLSYTVHQVLVSATPSFKTGDIDYCLGDLMGVIMNDIFGATSQEKEAQDYISKMREVRKKTLSYDSMELLASITTLPYVSNLLRPIKEQLGKPRTKLENIDELLRRLREGLRRNETVNDRDFLKLSYEILNEAYQNIDPVKGQSKQTSYKMASFALELLRRILDKHEVLKTPENLAGFLPLLRKAMDEQVEEVQMSAMRLLTSIIKVPLKDIDANAKIYVRRCKSLIDASASTNASVAQAALRLVSAILRERPNAHISKVDFDNNIAYLLTRIKPDLQEPARQGERDRQVAAFNFLKAVIGRKEPVNEAYQVMDVVREVMITSQEHPIPDLARSTYSRFVLDYFPDEMKGFSKQLEFLVSNLQYPHARGRLSVMEVVMFLLARKNEVAVQPILVTFFLPLLVVLATDADDQCRGSAQLLLHKILERADKERTKLFRSQMLKWFDAGTDPLWKRVGFQSWKIYFDIHTTANKEASAVFSEAADVIGGTSDGDTSSDSSKILHRALELLGKLCENYSNIVFGSKTSRLWAAVAQHLTHQSKDVKSHTASLISMYFADFARTTAKIPGRPQAFPLIGSGGLELTSQEASVIVKTSMRILQNEVDEGIITQVIQNVAFVGRMSIGGGSQDLLDQLFRQASAVVRMEGDGRPPRAKLAALKLIAALCKLVEPENIQPTLEDVLLPLYNLTDNTIPTASSSSDPTYLAVQDELLELAQEQLSVLQTKMGTSVYISAMQKVQKGVKERREERRTKRRIEAVSAPEKVGREKQKKNEAKRSKRRDKNALAAGRRRGW